MSDDDQQPITLDQFCEMLGDFGAGRPDDERWINVGDIQGGARGHGPDALIYIRFIGVDSVETWETDPQSDEEYDALPRYREVVFLDPATAAGLAAYVAMTLVNCGHADLMQARLKAVAFNALTGNVGFTADEQPS